jgi:hypothetical protein
LDIFPGTCGLGENFTGARGTVESPIQDASDGSLAVRQGSREAYVATRWPADSAAVTAFLLSQLLAHLDYLDETIDTLSAQLDVVIAPFTDDRRWSTTILKVLVDGSGSGYSRPLA